MDTKYILGSIQREAQKFGGRGTPDAAVRLTGAVNGMRGEGYWLLYDDLLIVLYRELAKRDYAGHAAFTDAWTFGECREEKYLLRMELRSGEYAYECDFTPSERESAEIILNAIVQARDTSTARFSEKELLAAALVASLSQGHEECAERILGHGLLRAGERRAAAIPLPELVEKCQTFSDDQKKSLIAVLTEIRMSDGIWTSAEQAALAELSSEWKLPEGTFDLISGVLILKNQCPGIFQ